MSTTAVDPDLARIDAELDALLSECDPKKVDNATFRGARFDRGLAWVHFPVGHGGLNMRPDLNRRVEERLRAAGAAPQDPATFVWIAEATDYTGKKIKLKGTVVLIRQ